MPRFMSSVPEFPVEVFREARERRERNAVANLRHIVVAELRVALSELPYRIPIRVATPPQPTSDANNKRYSATENDSEDGNFPLQSSVDIAVEKGSEYGIHVFPIMILIWRHGTCKSFLFGIPKFPFYHLDSGPHRIRHTALRIVRQLLPPEREFSL